MYNNDKRHIAHNQINIGNDLSNKHWKAIMKRKDFINSTEQIKSPFFGRRSPNHPIFAKDFLYPDPAHFRYVFLKKNHK
jgi:hypothetical protein